LCIWKEENTSQITRKLQLSGCRTSGTAKDVRITQTKLLVARFKRRCQEVCTRLFQISTEQSSTSEEIRRITSIENTPRAMARN